MRILTVGNLYPPHHLGGYELVWQSAVRALRAAGHEVVVLTTDNGEDSADEEDAGVHRELRWYWSDHEFPPLKPRVRLRIERHNAAVWQRHVRRLRPQVVSWWAMGGMSLSLVERARRTGLPAIGWVNDDWLAYGPDVDGWTRAWASRQGWRPLVETLTGVPVSADLDRAARWVFCSKALLTRTLLRRPELPDATVELQGVASQFTRRPAAPWRWRLLYVGRLDERKGIATAIEALVELPEATLRIVGGGDAAEESRLRALAVRLRVMARVSFEGQVGRTRLPDVYAEADATLFPVTWFEPFGLVPLESMAVGRPVIATGTGGSADYLRDRDNALLHSPGDAKSLASSVRELAHDRPLRDRLVEGGLETASKFTEANWLAAVVREHEQRTR